MKRIVPVLLAALLLTGLLSGCSTSKETEISVFAAASLTETLQTIKEAYEKEHPGVTIVYTFDSSGTLKTQIQEGAECDLFLSASPEQIKELGDLLEGTPTELLENKVALAVPEGNPAGIRSFDDLMQRLREGTVLLAIGNSDVPVGQYTLKILSHYGIDPQDPAIAACLTFGSNVKEVTTQVSQTVVDCGIIYATDACSAGLDTVDTATAEMCGQVIYPAALLKNSQNREAAQAFLEYLTGENAAQVFRSVGFRPMN